jgi:hypothetical protein
MRDWRIMLGPLLIWALHFLLVYGVASMADISDPSQKAAWRTAGLVLSGLCLLAIMAMGLMTRRLGRISPLARSLGLAGCGIGLIAVALQSLPLVLSA